MTNFSFLMKHFNKSLNNASSPTNNLYVDKPNETFLYVLIISIIMCVSFCLNGIVDFNKEKKRNADFS